MTLLSEIKNFLRKFIKNPFVLVAIAYIIYKQIKKHTKQESMQTEGIKILKRKGNSEIIYDTENKVYSLINNNTYIKSSKNINDLKIESYKERLYKIE